VRREAKKGTTLVQKEERETGVVSLAVVWRYVSAMGGTSSLAILMFFYLAIELARASPPPPGSPSGRARGAQSGDPGTPGAAQTLPGGAHRHVLSPGTPVYSTD